MNIDEEWERFMSDGFGNTNSPEFNSEKIKYKNTSIECSEPPEISALSESPDCPEPSDIYISTKSKIAYLNKTVDLQTVFWKIPVILYTTQKNGVVKKQMKFNSATQEEVDKITDNVKNEYHVVEQVLTTVTSPSGSKKWFKDVRKISIGVSKKDILSYRSKQKCAFYNCFVMILRILIEDRDDVDYNKYHEFHVKIFNTGKVEIPGIRSDYQLDAVLDNILLHLRPFIGEDLSYNGKCDTVLINSNFNCGFFIQRETLFDILKTKYNIQCIYDPCSYPGIQCKFYYDKTTLVQDGIRKHVNIEKEKKSSSIVVVSFMIFRTGSILIVGMCDESTLQEVYEFIKKLLKVEFSNIFQKLVDSGNLKPKAKKAKIRKKYIYVENSE